MGWPLTGVVTALTTWMVRRSDGFAEEAAAQGIIPTITVVDPDYVQHYLSKETEPRS